MVTKVKMKCCECYTDFITDEIKRMILFKKGEQYEIHKSVGYGKCLLRSYESCTGESFYEHYKHSYTLCEFTKNVYVKYVVCPICSKYIRLDEKNISDFENTDTIKIIDISTESFFEEEM